MQLEGLFKVKSKKKKRQDWFKKSVLNNWSIPKSQKGTESGVQKDKRSLLERWCRWNIPTEERKVCDVEIESTSFVVKVWSWLYLQINSSKTR